MRRTFAVTVVATALLVGASVRAQPAFTVSVGGIPANTTAPVLQIDAVIQDTGADLVKNPNSRVFVTVTSPGNDGGVPLVLPDGGFDTSHGAGPVVTGLSLIGVDRNRGLFTSTWEGNTPLFAGDNEVVVSAVQPSGARVDSAPQLVQLVLPGSGGSDAGTLPDGGSGGPPPDAGSGGGNQDGGTGGQDGGPTYGADGGLAQASQALVAGDSGQGCSTTGGGSPSFLLLALAAMLVGLGRRAIAP